MARIVAVVGDMGSGKTCFMTYLAYLDHMNDRKVIANYHLKFPYEFMPFKKMMELPDDIYRASLFADEIHMLADSRSIWKAGNKALTKLATQIRKRKCILYYTTQNMKQVDVRLRRVTDQWISCQPYGDPVRFVDGQPEYHYFRITVFNNQFEPPTSEKIFHGQPYFKFYDTEEIIDDPHDEIEEEQKKDKVIGKQLTLHDL